MKKFVYLPFFIQKVDIFDIHLKTTTFEKGQYIIITGKEYDERGWWRGFSDGKVRFSKKKKDVWS